MKKTKLMYFFSGRALSGEITIFI